MINSPATPNNENGNLSADDVLKARKDENNRKNLALAREKKKALGITRAAAKITTPSITIVPLLDSDIVDKAPVITTPLPAKKKVTPVKPTATSNADSSSEDQKSLFKDMHKTMSKHAISIFATLLITICLPFLSGIVKTILTTFGVVPRGTSNLDERGVSNQSTYSPPKPSPQPVQPQTHNSTVQNEPKASPSYSIFRAM